CRARPGRSGLVPVRAATAAARTVTVGHASRRAGRIDLALARVAASDGGLDPGLRRTEEACALLVRAFEAAGPRPGHDVAIGLDLAASELADGDRYHLPARTGACRARR